METTIKEIKLTELLEMFDESVHERLIMLLAKNEALVVFENMDFWSSQAGNRTALAIGPNCTYTSLEQIKGRHLGDVPSRFQYPVAVCKKEGMNV